MLNEPRGRIDKLSENLFKEIETTKNFSEMKNTLEEINRLDEAEDQVSDLEDQGA